MKATAYRADCLRYTHRSECLVIINILEQSVQIDVFFNLVVHRALTRKAHIRFALCKIGHQKVSHKSGSKH